MLVSSNGSKSINVAPLAGAWIEINKNPLFLLRDIKVAPLAGAWIEIIILNQSIQPIFSRSPRGSVD